MTTPTPTPEEHRAYAESLLAKVYTDAYAPMHPYRVDMLNRATVHALLSVGPITVTHDIRYEAVGVPAAGGGVAPASSCTCNDASPCATHFAEHAGREAKYDAIVAVSDLGEDAPSKPLPRKRAAKKTTTPKETTK